MDIFKEILWEILESLVRIIFRELAEYILHILKGSGVSGWALMGVGTIMIKKNDGTTIIVEKDDEGTWITDDDGTRRPLVSDESAD